MRIEILDEKISFSFFFYTFNMYYRIYKGLTQEISKKEIRSLICIILIP